MRHGERAGGKSAGVVLIGTGRGFKALEGVGPRAQHGCIQRLPGAVFQPQGVLHAEGAALRVEAAFDHAFVQPFGCGQQLGGWMLHLQGLIQHPKAAEQQHHQRCRRKDDCFLQIKDPTLPSSTKMRRITPFISRPPTVPASAIVTKTDTTVHTSLAGISSLSGRAMMRLSMPQALV